MITDIVTRWLRSRQAVVDMAPAGLRVTLAADDVLRATLGDTFLLASSGSTGPARPGVESLYHGSRITDLLAVDLADARGIAVVHGPIEDGAPRYVFAYQAVYAANRRTERLIRVALAADGSPAALPLDPEPPLRAGGDGRVHRSAVERLLPEANRQAQALALPEIERVEREAQLRLYQAARRLALVYGLRSAAGEGDEERQAEFRRMVGQEVDRHRLTVSLTLLGVTVIIGR